MSPEPAKPLSRLFGSDDARVSELEFMASLEKNGSMVEISGHFVHVHDLHPRVFKDMACGFREVLPLISTDSDSSERRHAIPEPIPEDVSRE